ANAIKDLENHAPKEDFFRSLFTDIKDLLNQKLAYSVRSTISIRELMRPQDWVLGPRLRFAIKSSKENLLPFGCKSPKRVINDRWLELEEFGPNIHVVRQYF